MDCATYKPIVKEEQRRGTFVIQVNKIHIIEEFFDKSRKFQVTAVDNDPKESGGTVSYEIITEDRKYFNVNSTTGIITTNAVFDRDEPSRQKQLYVTVRATDNGRPVLADVCTFKVTIDDINDNDPVFDQTVFKLLI